MNLLKDAFISTTDGKVSLKDILSADKNYQLQYYFDETQLAMLQLLASLVTVLFKPTMAELKKYLINGISAQQYDEKLNRMDTKWFEDDCFMQSTFPQDVKVSDAPITKLVSGVECGSSVHALGLFANRDEVSHACADCIHVLNYNLHMNIKGEYFGPSGATGIRGGGAISTLITMDSLQKTILANTIAYDFFEQQAKLDANAENRFMWDKAPLCDTYFASQIGLSRGLFALAYHIHFPLQDKPAVCHICGHHSDRIASTFQRLKYAGSYGATKKGRDTGAGWWLHPYTPRNIKEDGVYAVCARGQSWQSWQELTAYIVGSQSNKVEVKPAYISVQFQNNLSAQKMNLLIGGNITDQGSVTGRVYDLFAMPSQLATNHQRVTQVITAGIEQQNKLSTSFNKLFGIENFASGIKEQAMQCFTANAQQIIQQILLDVDNKKPEQLKQETITLLNVEAKTIFKSVQRKYQHDLPMFKALVKGEHLLYK